LTSEGGLFTKKFELFFKGSPSTSSGQARKRPHPLAAPSLPIACPPLAGPSASHIFCARDFLALRARILNYFPVVSFVYSS
jgi:hypothetical protein